MVSCLGLFSYGYWEHFFHLFSRARPHTFTVLQQPFVSITQCMRPQCVALLSKVMLHSGTPDSEWIQCWHISTCSLALQMSGFFHVVLPQVLKTKLIRSANLCILLLVHHVLLGELRHNEVTYCLCMRDLCDCLLQNRAYSMDGHQLLQDGLGLSLH